MIKNVDLMNKKNDTYFYKKINFIFFIFLSVIILLILLSIEIFYKNEFIKYTTSRFSERELKLHLLKNNDVKNIILGPSSSTTMSPDVFNYHKLNKNISIDNNFSETSKSKSLNLSFGGGTIKEFFSYINFSIKNNKTKTIVLNLRIQSFKDDFDYKYMPINFSSSSDDFLLFSNVLEKNFSEVFSSTKIKFIFHKLYFKEKNNKEVPYKNEIEKEYISKGIRYNPVFLLENNLKKSDGKNIRNQAINLDELNINFSKNFKYLKKIVDLCNAYNVELFIVFDPLAINKLVHMKYSYQKKEIELLKLILDIYPEVYYFNNHNQINNDLKYFNYDYEHYNYDAANIILNEVLSGDLKNGIKLRKETLNLLESKFQNN